MFAYAHNFYQSRSVPVMHATSLEVFEKKGLSEWNS